jgi:hypothetical protein
MIKKLQKMASQYEGVDSPSLKFKQQEDDFDSSSEEISLASGVNEADTKDLI